MIPDLGRALIDGIEALEAAGVRYAMVGGLAVSTWATPRATGDADLYAELPERARSAVERELRARGFHVPAMREELERFGVFRSRSPAGIFLDIFDSVTLVRDLGPSLDLRYVKEWARRLDESIGGDDVSERVHRAITAAKVKKEHRR